MDKLIVAEAGNAACYIPLSCQNEAQLSADVAAVSRPRQKQLFKRLVTLLAAVPRIGLYCGVSDDERRSQWLAALPLAASFVAEGKGLTWQLFSSSIRGVIDTSDITIPRANCARSLRAASAHASAEAHSWRSAGKGKPALDLASRLEDSAKALLDEAAAAESRAADCEQPNSAVGRAAAALAAANPYIRVYCGSRWENADGTSEEDPHFVLCARQPQRPGDAEELCVAACVCEHPAFVARAAGLAEIRVTGGAAVAFTASGRALATAPDCRFLAVVALPEREPTSALEQLPPDALEALCVAAKWTPPQHTMHPADPLAPLRALLESGYRLHQDPAAWLEHNASRVIVLPPALPRDSADARLYRLAPSASEEADADPPEPARRATEEEEWEPLPADEVCATAAVEEGAADTAADTQKKRRAGSAAVRDGGDAEEAAPQKKKLRAAPEPSQLATAADTPAPRKSGGSFLSQLLQKKK